MWMLRSAFQWTQRGQKEEKPGKLTIHRSPRALESSGADSDELRQKPLALPTTHIRTPDHVASFPGPWPDQSSLQVGWLCYCDGYLTEIFGNGGTAAITSMLALLFPTEGSRQRTVFWWCSSSWTRVYPPLLQAGSFVVAALLYPYGLSTILAFSA